MQFWYNYTCSVEISEKIKFQMCYSLLINSVTDLAQHEYLILVLSIVK